MFVGHLLVSNGIFHHYNKNLKDALDFLNNLQNPTNCVNQTYAVVQMGIAGGFAAQFQLAGSEWTQALASLDFKVPVIIRGRMMGYSEGKECEHVKNDWTCFFYPVSKCQEEFLQSGKEVAWKSMSLPDTTPKQYSHLGFAFWWGVLQYKMFHVQPYIEEHIKEESKSKDFGRGFPFGLPTIGMHVRHGDKAIDGFRLHSLTEEMNAVFRSPDCYIRNKHNNCFYKIEITYQNFHRIVKKSHHPLTILNSSHIDEYNATSPENQRELSVDPMMIMSQLHLDHVRKRQMEGNKHSNVSDDSIQPEESIVGHDGSVYVSPVKVFVASDDLNVLLAAEKSGFLVDTAGVRFVEIFIRLG